MKEAFGLIAGKGTFRGRDVLVLPGTVVSFFPYYEIV